MPKRRARAMPAVADYGPRIRIDRGEVVVADRPDTGDGAVPNRTIRGAYRRSGYDWLHARGVINDRQREAADRYAVAHERITGAGNRTSGGGVPPWQQGHPAAAQVQAAADIRGAHTVIRSGANRLVLEGIVLHATPVDRLATILSEPIAGITGRLRAVLDILADEWVLD